MSGVTTQGAKPRNGRFRRWLRRGALLALAAIMVLAVALATGRPQRAGLQWGIEQALGVHVEVGAVQLFGAIRISDLTIYDDDVALARSVPAVKVESLTCNYRLAALFEAGGY